MTTPDANFSARSDSAALRIKEQLSKQYGKEIKPRSVQVDSDGRPAQPPPPEGSYARQAMEAQRRAQQARPDLQQPLEAPPQQQAGPQQNGQLQPAQDPQGQADSPHAQRRFSELTAVLRQREQALQQAEARAQQLQESQAATQARLQSIELNYQKLVSQNLESLDPETRMKVMQDAQIQEAIAGVESRVMQRFAPLIDDVRQASAVADLQRVAARYPGFDANVHIPLIEVYREKNPHSSIEQAFKAVAEPEELFVQPADRAPAIPPIAMPSPNSGAGPRYVPPPQADLAAELEELRARAFKLADSMKPEDRRIAGRAMDAYLRVKMDGRLPTGKPAQRR